jgi:hypothetical protein
METDRITSWYVSRRVDAPVDVVAIVLDRVLEDPAVRQPEEGLTVGPEAVVYPPFPGAPRRRLRAKLSPRGRVRSLLVELELVPWSHRSAELGIRPVRRVPRGGSAAAYFEAAGVALEGMRDQVHDALPARIATAGGRLERAS